MSGMYTPRVKRVLSLGRDESARLHHNYVGTEHLLLGILREGSGMAASILVSLNLTLDEIRQSIEESISVSSSSLSIGQVPLTPRAKRALEQASDEARSRSARQIGTEHLLLALLTDAKGVAAQVLNGYQVTYEVVSKELEKMGSPESSTGSAPSGPPKGHLINLDLKLGEFRPSVDVTIPASSVTLTIDGFPLSSRAKQILEQASRKAREMRAELVSSEHLLWTLLADEKGIAALVLSLCKIDRQKLIGELEQILSKDNQHREGP